jgi:ABC-type transporter Mla subunit MlaD
MVGSCMLVATLVLFLVAFCGRAQAQELPAILDRGQPAHVPGLLLNEDQAKRAAEEIRNARSLAGQVETLKAALAAKERENAQLTAALEKASAALDLAGKIQEASDKVIARYEQALKVADASIERSGKALERADKRIDSLEAQQKWMMFGGVLALAAGFFLGAF